MTELIAVGLRRLLLPVPHPATLHDNVALAAVQDRDSKRPYTEERPPRPGVLKTPRPY
jgi:hypothetical protein